MNLTDLAIHHRLTVYVLMALIVVAGASAYPRIIDFNFFAEVAESCKAYLMVDMAHIAGLVAADLHPSPVPFADVVTSTTHKTLRGPRGGIILAKKNEEIEKKLNSLVFPGTQGGPLMHTIAAKAVAFAEAMEPEWNEYQKRVVENSAVLCQAVQDRGWRIVSGGTDNHLFLVDLGSDFISGKKASSCSGSISQSRNWRKPGRA